MPLTWTVRAVLITGGTLGFIVALAIAGVVLRGDAGRGFAEDRPGTWASVGLLCWGALIAARVGWRNTTAVSRWFWFIAATSLALLAVDDYYELHERLDFAIHARFGWDPEHAVTDRIDDVLVGLYGLVALAVGWSHRRELLRLPLFVWPMIAAGAFFAVMVALDIIDRGGMAPEEGAKLMAGACIVCAMYGALLSPYTGGAGAACESGEPRFATR